VFGISDLRGSARRNLSRQGCPQGDLPGTGKTGIFEFLTMSDAVQEMVLEKKSTNIIKEKAREEGMTVLREDGMKKVLAGITTVEEVLRVTQDEAFA
jgi:type II secretory ATPase GspE/PulE/Tfp pilus assembly ATPase PilB-like protein